MEEPMKAVGATVKAVRPVTEFVSQLAVLALVVFSARSSLADWYEVPSGSMLPTIQLGDRVFVNKLAYDVRLPFSKVSLMRTGEPQRGDIVVFSFPRDGKTDYIKRLIGLPGDQVELRDEVLYVNGTMIDRVEVSQETLPPGAAKEPNALLYQETIDGVKHFVFERTDRSLSPFFSFDELKILSRDVEYRSPENDMEAKALELCPVVGDRVPPDCYFMMGDNRDDSADSRSWGFVHRSYLKGRALRVVLSWHPHVWNVDGHRPSRFLLRLDPPRMD